MARYNKIRKMDIANGEGVRISIFMQGCPFHCNGCFNKETWDYSKGEEFNDDTINTLINLAKPEHIRGLSILGGEPLCKENIDGVIKLTKEFKKVYPDKTIWLWTGYLFDNIIKKEVLNNIDILVDGQFKENLHNPTLHWKGSSNQRVIDVKKTLKKKEIVIYGG